MYVQLGSPVAFLIVIVLLDAKKKKKEPMLIMLGLIKHAVLCQCVF